jgi:hypothetical protein
MSDLLLIIPFFTWIGMSFISVRIRVLSNFSAATLEHTCCDISFISCILFLADDIAFPLSGRMVSIAKI